MAKLKRKQNNYENSTFSDCYAGANT